MALEGALRGARRLLLAAALGLWACGEGAPAALPNIVLIVSDDHGWPDFGFMGSERALTPNLDQLASEGVVFTHAFNTASTCRPSLATLLSGLTPVQLQARLAPADAEAGGGQGYRAATARRTAALAAAGTLPQLLGRRGYATFQGGKHWEGTYREAGFSHGVSEEHSGPLSGGGPPARALGRETLEPLFDFIDEHREVPFFVWFAPILPHPPFDAGPSFTERHRASGAAAPYLANVSRLDARVGELLERLEALALRERTLVVFLTDNGWDALTPDDDPLLLVLGGPDGKGSIRELGFRTPLVFSWPGVLPEGRRDARLVSTTDLFPTLLDFASAAIPPGRTGASLHPLLTGQGDFTREQVIGRVTSVRDAGLEAKGRVKPVKREAWFLRTPEWRTVWYPETGEQELYYIEDDPFETRNVAADHPEVTAPLRAELEAARSLAPLGVGNGKESRH